MRRSRRIGWKGIVGAGVVMLFGIMVFSPGNDTPATAPAPAVPAERLITTDIPLDTPIPPTVLPAELPTATPVPLPTDTLAPTPIPTLCACTENLYNCGDFNSLIRGEAAQVCYRHCMETAGVDIHELDGDGDGYACEWQP